MERVVNGLGDWVDVGSFGGFDFEGVDKVDFGFFWAAVLALLEL